VDSQIGSDIAKLLGTLGKSTGSAPQTASNSDAGTAFKRALAASEQAQAGTTTGKHLPAASGTAQTVAVATSVASVASPKRPDTEQPTSHTALPGFDLLVVGDPADQSAILKFAKASGLSSAALAELFPVGANDAVNPAAPEGALAHAVAQAIADWMAANQGAQSFGSVEKTGTSAGVVSAGLPESMGDALNNAVIALMPAATESDEFSLAGLAQAVASEIQPVIDRWQAQLNSGAAAGEAQAQLNALRQQIEKVIQPLAMQWMGDNASLAASVGVSGDELVARLTETAATSQTASVPAADAAAIPAGIGQALQSVVSRWLEQNPGFNQPVVSEQWLRELTDSVKPNVTTWMAEPAEGRGNVIQLAANILPQIAQALQALSLHRDAKSPELNQLAGDVAPAPVRLASMTAVPSAALMGATPADLTAARANALSQPQPISVAITGAEWDGERPAAKPLASVLTQVMAPAAAQPSLSETTVISQATLDRFALRSAGMRSESLSSGVKADASVVTTEGVKTVNVETVTALRDIVTARTLELARLGAQIEKSVTGAPAGSSPSPFAGLVQAEASDNSVARLAGQSELTFRQNLANVDRAGLADSARFNQFSLNQNAAGREMAGRALSEALGQRLVANIAAGHYRLAFNVNPRELGAIDVVMEMRDGRLDAQINTTNAVTRELLGDSLPRLRDALQQSGINLAHLQVGSESQQGNAQGRNSGTDSPEQHLADERLLADTTADVVSEDIDLGLDLDSVDFWA
jgi:flagellar hook-length control protein FliK